VSDGDVTAPTLVQPDRAFLGSLLSGGGEDLKRCFQCAACSVVCELSRADSPFPRKEMLWAQWGLKDRLLADVDVWLCHDCADCSARCPRGARPGDVLAAIRRESILHYAFPRFLGRWVNQPRFLPLLLLLPALVLGLAILARDPVERALGISAALDDRIVLPTWNQLPQSLLITLFGLVALLDVVAITVGVARFWRDMGATDRRAGRPAGGLAPRRLLPSLVSALGAIFRHDDFGRCTAERSRQVAHMAVFLGFCALVVVDLWVLSARFNPLILDGVVYPFGFWSPWKILANLGGLAVLGGGLLMVRDRLKSSRPGTYFDWAFLGILLSVVLTGFASEALHYARMDVVRQVAYFCHLVSAFVLLVFLPHSKFAHMIYRTVAMVYAERSGRHLAEGIHGRA